MSLGNDLARVSVRITQEEATAALLRLVRSPLVGNVDVDTSCGETLLRIHDECYAQLSTGEQCLVDIAVSVWTGRDDAGARVAAIGGLDLALRRRVLVVLMYYFLGVDTPLAVTGREFDELFIGATP